MRFKYLLIAFLFFITKTFSQEKQEVLFTIDNEPFYAQEFINVYKKNVHLVSDSTITIKSYLDLFVDYKLKVKEAKELGLDTLPKFKKEFKSYKNNLINSFLKDNETTKKLAKEAYNRLKKEVKASHILIFLKPEATPADTLAAYNKLIEARNLILQGNDFVKIAKKYSQDPSVQQNGGDLGYFTAFQMIYEFENVAYSTQVNTVSMPFRTKFGYHILKVFDVRDSKGEVEVAHIMLKGDDVVSKKKIDSIYSVLKKNQVEFTSLAKIISDDKASAVNGGKLNRFSAGQMVDEFSNIAFSLKEEGEISQPFKTQFGWHIVKLLKKYPVESFEVMEVGLNQKVERDNRSNLIGKSLTNKLLKQYNVAVNEKALHQFEVDDWKLNSHKFDKKLLTINGKVITQNQFINFLKKNRFNSVKQAFNNFKEQEVLNYYKENIEFTNTEYATVLNEFKEGLLLFDLLENKVWNKSKDTINIDAFYKKNSKKYHNRELETIKGTVLVDYQNYLEQKLVKQLREKYEITFNTKVKDHILNLKI